MKTVISRKPSETLKLAKRIASALTLPATLALWGSLGTGKTQFVKGLAAGLGIRQTILSPTFLLYREYPFRQQGYRYNLYHFDLYRLKKISEIKNFGLNDILRDPKGLIVIEWPKLIQKKLPKRTFSIFFTHGQSPQERKIQIPSPLSKFV